MSALRVADPLVSHQRQSADAFARLSLRRQQDASEELVEGHEPPTRFAAQGCASVTFVERQHFFVVKSGVTAGRVSSSVLSSASFPSHQARFVRASDNFRAIQSGCFLNASGIGVACRRRKSCPSRWSSDALSPPSSNALHRDLPGSRDKANQTSVSAST